MNGKVWSLQDAKNRFSAVVEAAMGGEPQAVTKRGEEAVTVISTEEYRRLKEAAEAKKPTLGEYLLMMPQDDGDFERIDIAPRDVAF